MIERKTIWEEASRKGLILGIITITYLILGLFLDKLIAGGGARAVIGNVLTTVLWIVKTTVCIYLLYKFISRFRLDNAEAERSDCYRFGSTLSFLSALLYSAFYLAYVLFINPTIFSDAVSMMDGMLPAEALESAQNMLPSMPAIGFFSNLIYCWLFGVILSLIFSRTGEDIFRDGNTDNSEGQKEEEEW